MQEKLDALVRTQAMQLFRQQGLHFTMQQVAEPLHISKKTIYTVYPSKEALLLDMVDHAFAPGPPVQVWQVAVPAGGPGEPGVDMKISNIHGCPPLFTRIPSIIPFFSLRCNARAGFLPLFLSYSGS